MYTDTMATEASTTMVYVISSFRLGQATFRSSALTSRRNFAARVQGLGLTFPDTATKAAHILYPQLTGFFVNSMGLTSIAVLT